MKKYFQILAALVVGLTFSTVQAQPGRGGMGGLPSGPHLGGNMAKIFGEHSAFSANVEMRLTGGPAGQMTTPGKLAYLDGQSRFEIDMAETKGSPMPAEQMKQMGMDKMVTISRPDKKLSYHIFPGLKAYAEGPLEEPDAAKPQSDYKMEVTELGKDTVDDHACVKSKVVMTDKDGKSQEFTVWNATDLKKFPVKIETLEQTTYVTILYKDVKLSKPDAALFDPPSDFTKYPSRMAMMQGEMMKRMGGGMGGPPGQ